MWGEGVPNFRYDGPEEGLILKVTCEKTAKETECISQLWALRQGSTPKEEAAKETIWQACSGTTTEASE